MNPSNKSSGPKKTPAVRGRKTAIGKAPASAGKNAATANAIKSEKTDKLKKIKMVRDSFTMPETEYAQIGDLKKKCLQAGVHVKKSELLRVGLTLLSELPEAALLKAVNQVEHIKTGRPAKS